MNVNHPRCGLAAASLHEGRHERTGEGRIRGVRSAAHRGGPLR